MVKSEIATAAMSPSFFEDAIDMVTHSHVSQRQGNPYLDGTVEPSSAVEHKVISSRIETSMALRQEAPSIHRNIPT